MKLKDKAKPSIPPMEAGVYMAVCTMVIDIGQHYNEKFKKVENKALLAFDIPSETIDVDGEKKPRQLSVRLSFASGSNSKMYKFLCSWLNKRFSTEEIREFELFDLVGKGCQVQVTVSEDCNYNNIESVMALPKGVPAPVSSNPTYTYDIDKDGFSGEKWDSLPEWVHGIIEKSEQYQQDPPAKPLDMPEQEEKISSSEKEEVCPI